MRKNFNKLVKEINKLKKDKDGMRNQIKEIKKGVRKEEKRGERKWEEEIVGERGGKNREENWENLDVRMRRLELEKEKKKRKERKRNVIIRRVAVKKEGVEELREKVEEIVKTTGAVARVGKIRKIGIREREGERWCE